MEHTDFVNNESSPSKEESDRRILVQNTIDRMLKYGVKYIEELEALNSKYPIDVIEENNVRIYK